MPINSISKVNLEIFLSCRYQKVQGSAVDPVLFGLIKRENFMPSQKLLITVFYFLKRRYNSCTIKFTLLGSIQNYATFTIPYYRTFSSTQKRTFYPLVTASFPVPSPWPPSICFLFLWICLFWIFPRNGAIQHEGLCGWLLLLSQHNVYKAHPQHSMSHVDALLSTAEQYSIARIYPILFIS